MGYVLVTGGTGFIGSHTVVELIRAGKDVLIVDSLINSKRAVLDQIKKITGIKPKFIQADLIDENAVTRIFTENDERPLEEVMQSIHKVLDGKPTPFEPKKADGKEMFALLEKALPDYDRERVHTSDVKKLFAWYNILLGADKITFDEPEAAQEGENK